MDIIICNLEKSNIGKNGEIVIFIKIDGYILYIIYYIL